MQLTLPYTDLTVAAPRIQRRKYQVLLGIACVYFFFNSFLLPDGLLYTILLSPIFLVWLRLHKVPIGRYAFIYFLCWLPLLVIHYAYGISLPDYLKSSVLYFTVFLFAVTVHTYFRHYSFTYESIMEKVLKLNFLFVIVAVFLLVADKKDILWSVTDISEGVSDFPRLRMLTYEPSYYSLLLIPSLLYYFQYIFYRNISRRQWVLLITVLISLGLSLSYGAIFISMLSLGLFVLFNFLSGLRRQQNKRFILFLGILFVLAVTLVLGLFSNSGFVLRILNIFDGNDSSINNRSSQAYFLALSIADLKSQIFGVGPGQLKLLGQDLISTVYSFATDEATGQTGTARIPSSMAETLAIFGYLGFFLKIAFELYLFRKTRVKRSSFRFCLFIFMFIYQFVGSFSTNIVEIFFWVLAFSGAFPDTWFKKPDPDPRPEELHLQV